MTDSATSGGVGVPMLICVIAAASLSLTRKSIRSAATPGASVLAAATSTSAVYMRQSSSAPLISGKDAMFSPPSRRTPNALTCVALEKRIATWP